MISGEFNSKGELIFEICLIAADGDVIPIKALLDTGFIGWLAMDNQDAESLGWLFGDQQEMMRTARGEARFNLYQGNVLLDGEELAIPVLGGEELADILLGVRWLQNKRLVADFPAGVLTLASAKGKRLTPVEKLHLRGLLCGYSPAEIAERLNKSVKGVGVDFSNTLYLYVKNLVGKCNEKVENWRNITEWLEEAGYKTQPSSEYQELSDCLPLKFLIKKANIMLDKEQLIIDFNLRIIAPSSSELPRIEDLDTKEIDTNGKG